MKKNLLLGLLLLVLLFTLSGCGKKQNAAQKGDMAVDEATDAVFVCTLKDTTGEEKEYTIITTGNGKVQSVLYSAYIKASTSDEYNKYCDSYKTDKGNYDEKYSYGDVNCNDSELIVSSKQEWKIDGDINKKYPESVKNHVNSVGNIDIKAMKEDFKKQGYVCIKR